MQKKVQKLHNLINILDRKLGNVSLSHSQKEGWANFFAQFKMGRLEARDIVVASEISIAVGLNKKANDILIVAYDLMGTSFIVLEALVQTFRNLEQDNKAEIYLKKHLKKDPDNWDVTRLLGRLYFHTGQKDKQVDLVKSYMLQHSNHVAAHIELATQKLSSNANDIEECLLGILEIEPHNFYALSQLFQHYTQVPDFNRAASYLEKLQRLFPDEALTRYCEGFAHEHHGLFEKALASYNQALTLNPHFIEAYGKSAGMMHKLGVDLEESWYRLESRFPQLLGRPDGPFWRGEDLKDKHLIIWAEQGLGDQLCFASMLRDLPNDAAKIDLECDEKILPLFKRSFPKFNVFKRRTKRPVGHDYHVPIGAVARYLRTDFESFTKTASIPLTPAAQDIQKWSKWLDGLGNGLKVGLCWRSGTKSRVRKRDSIDLCRNLGPILKRKNIKFINVFYGDAEVELNEVMEELGIQIHQPPALDQYDDIDQTAALLKALDVVVGGATAPLRLAQSVGTDSVILYTGDPGKVDPLWWPTSTYLMRKMDEDWDNVIEQLGHYLDDYPERK